MTRVVRVPVEPMTASAFAPFGAVMDAPERPRDVRRMFPVDFECDGRTTINVIWQPPAGRRFSRLERHFAVTQAFMQLAGDRCVVCVAQATGRDGPDSLPHPDQVRGFLIDPALGFAFHRGTWHSLDRYVLGDTGGTFVILNSDPNPTQIVDYADGTSRTFRDLDVDRPTVVPCPELERVAFEVADG